ncbi:MAG: CHAT domain-containing tetratricopeptide repeat protein [Pyrinomonadaceae bacterium]
MFGPIFRPTLSLSSFHRLIRNSLLLLLTISLLTGTLGAQSDEDILTLGLGRPVGRELAGGQSHSYRIILTSGQYVHLVVDQRGIDVVATLFGSDGKQIIEVDSPNGILGPEPIYAVAGSSGTYRLEVRSLEKGVAAGRYEVKIKELRMATQQDKNRVTAERAFNEAELMRVEGTVESLRSAIKKYEEALVLYPADRNRSREAMALHSLGAVYYLIGERQKALYYYERALPIFHLTGGSREEADTLNSIGLLYDDLGEKQKALDYYRRSLMLRTDIGDRSGEATTLSNIGSVYDSLGEKQKALDYFGKTLPLYRAVKDHNGEATALNNIALVHYSLGSKLKAIDYFVQALTLHRAVGNRRAEAVQLSNIGSAYDSLGEKQKALDYYAQALPLRRAAGDRSGEATTLYKLMIVHHSLNNPRLAIFYGKQSVDAYQQLRSNIHGLDKEVQQTYLKSVERAYRGLAELLITQDRAAEAQQVLNAFKDQQFFDFNQMQSRQLKLLTRTPREEDFGARYEKTSDTLGIIGGKLAELIRELRNRQPNDEQAQHLRQIEAQFKIASDAFSVFIKQAEAEFSMATDAKNRVSDVPDTIEMQEALRQLNQETRQKTVAVYTLVGQDHFYASIITSNSIDSVVTQIKGTEINNNARQLWALLQSAAYDPTVLSNELYTSIFKPIEDKLPKDTKTIMWSLDGNLRYLPMAALYDGKQYLLERFNHIVFTRADKERLTRAVSDTWTGYGFATSVPHKVVVDGQPIAFGPLDFVKDEMQIFRTKSYPDGIIDGEVFPEAKFTKASLLTTLRQKRPVVHISSHFRFHPGDESLSFLLLGDGTIMTLAEMKEHANLFQGVELLTLSACDTAAQRADATGREVDAFAELAQRLGASGVMASLWEVLDRSTAQLMKDFYRNRQGGKLSKAEALRKAQLDLLYGKTQNVGTPTNKTNGTIRRGSSTDDDIVVEPKYRIPVKVDKKKPFAHPFYWSPFVLFGNWK